MVVNYLLEGLVAITVKVLTLEIISGPLAVWTLLGDRNWQHIMK